MAWISDGLKKTMSSEYNEYITLFKKGRYTQAARFAELQHLEGNRNNPFWLTRQAAAVCRFLENELPELLKICTAQNGRLILTADHGLSLTRTGLSHGQGGVLEQAIFRVEWEPAPSNPFVK